MAIVLIAALFVVISKSRNRHRMRKAEAIREQARVESARVERREALAQETAAKARAAQAEAEVKAAEAARLQEHAAKHQRDAAASRDRLQEQFDRADSIDPKTGNKDREEAESARDRDDAWSSESPDAMTDAEAVKHETYRGTRG
ncbi:hypothetical protein SKC41_10090 [Mycobacterium sp. 050128]|uniref:hypothetical protein n=1 Tax=Mycobacterium sp. 050128 TaxID=3096112 RepID=UPI002EDAA4BF